MRSLLFLVVGIFAQSSTTTTRSTTPISQNTTTSSSTTSLAILTNSTTSTTLTTSTLTTLTSTSTLRRSTTGTSTSTVRTPAATTTMNFDLALQVQDIQYPDVPLDANMQQALQTGQFFKDTFGNLPVSIPTSIIATVLVFMTIYIVAQGIYRYGIYQKVAKYKAMPVSPNMPLSPTEQSSQQTTSVRLPTKATVPPASGYQTSNSNTVSARTGKGAPGVTQRFNVDFGAANVGLEQTEESDQHPDDQATDIGAAEEQDSPDRDPNVYTELESPSFALPGFLAMNFTEDLRLKGKLAEGGGGVVYKGELLNQEFIDRYKVDQVVVKVLKPLPHMSFSDLKSVVFQEIAIMQALSHHPNSICLVGYSEEPLSIVTKLYDRNMFSLVMSLPEYASNTAEFEALKSFVKTDSKLKKGLIVKGFEMLPEIALHLAWGVAAGMNEMHIMNILHRDLKSANVLLEFKQNAIQGEKPIWMADPSLAAMASKISGSFNQNALAGGVGWGTDASGRPFCPVNPVICDFGLAKVIKKSAGGTKDVVATGISYRYAAPEAFNRMYSKGQNATEEAKPVDVYAFAIIVWELLERKVPFHKMANKEIETKVRAGERPHVQSKYRQFDAPVDGNKHYPVLVKLIDTCWKQKAKDRPSFFEVKQKLKPFWLGYKDPKDFGSSGNSERLTTPSLKATKSITSRFQTQSKTKTSQSKSMRLPTVDQLSGDVPPMPKMEGASSKSKRLNEQQPQVKTLLMSQDYNRQGAQKSGGNSQRIPQQGTAILQRNDSYGPGSLGKPKNQDPTLVLPNSQTQSPQYAQFPIQTETIPTQVLPNHQTQQYQSKVQTNQYPTTVMPNQFVTQSPLNQNMNATMIDEGEYVVGQPNYAMAGTLGPQGQFMPQYPMQAASQGATLIDEGELVQAPYQMQPQMVPQMMMSPQMMQQYGMMMSPQMMQFQNPNANATMIDEGEYVQQPPAGATILDEGAYITNPYDQMMQQQMMYGMQPQFYQNQYQYQQPNMNATMIDDADYVQQPNMNATMIDDADFVPPQQQQVQPYAQSPSGQMNSGSQQFDQVQQETPQLQQSTANLLDQMFAAQNEIGQSNDSMPQKTAGQSLQQVNKSQKSLQQSGKAESQDQVRQSQKSLPKGSQGSIQKSQPIQVDDDLAENSLLKMKPSTPQKPKHLQDIRLSKFMAESPTLVARNDDNDDDVVKSEASLERQEIQNSQLMLAIAEIPQSGDVVQDNNFGAPSTFIDGPKKFQKLSQQDLDQLDEEGIQQYKSIERLSQMLPDEPTTDHIAGTDYAAALDGLLNEAFKSMDNVNQ